MQDVTKNKVKTISHQLALLGLVLAFQVQQPLFAQSMEEVVVEAERQDDSTLDLTESIDAFDLEDLETQGIKGFADISNAVPGLTSSPAGAQGLRFTLRGIGARDSQLGVESKVGLYVDGAFLGRASGLVFDIIDLERVEVLKGPQGFHFGRNAIGGAINLITAKADVEGVYGRLETKVGNFERRNVTGILNLPITDTFAVRFGGFKNTADGWVENKGLGVDFNGYDREGYRFTARWHATEDITIDYSYDNSDFVTQPLYYQPLLLEGATSFNRADYQQRGNSPNNIGIYQQGSGGLPDGPQEVFLDPLGSRRLEETTATLREIENSTTVADGHSLNFEWAWSDSHTFKFIGTHRTSDVNNTFYFFPNIASQEILSTSIAQAPRDFIFDVIEGDSFFGAGYVYGAPGFENLSIFGQGAVQGVSQVDSLALRLGCDPYIGSGPILCGNPITPLPPGLDNTTIIGNILNAPIVDNLRLRNRLSSIFSSPEGGTASLRDHKQWSIELNQSGFFLDDRLSYQTGVYYFNERTGNGRQLDGENELYLDVIDLLDFGRPVRGITDGFGFSFVSLNRLNSEVLGVYTTVDYTPLWLDERLHLTVGGRYTRDQRDLSRQSLFAFSLDFRGPPELEDDVWEAFDPKVKVAYDVSEEVTAYFSVITGFRSGNFNVEARQLPIAQGGQLVTGSDIAFDQETQIAYEFGVKGSLWNGLADFEFASYYSDVNDGQETVVFPTSPISRAVVNADGYAYGIELDTKWHFTDELTFTLNYALLRSGSDEYVTPFVADFDRPLIPADIVAGLNNPDPLIAADAASDQRDFNELTRKCDGGLRRLDLENGRCVERKSNFGAPVNSWQSAIDYRLPTEFGEVFLHLGYSYKDAFFVNDTLKVDSRNLWDMRIQAQFDTHFGVVRTALWSQNLFDNQYQTQKFELNATAYDIAAYGTPRTFGIDVIVEWE